MVPYLDLKLQYEALRPEIDAAISRVLSSGVVILGPELDAFEEEFAAYCGARHCAGVNSGTSALHLALLAAGIGEGDEVITTPFTFVATAAAIGYAGARPVFADIEERTFNLDPAKIEAVITARTKAVMPVHLFGQPADMDPISEIARRHNLLVIEDAAQAHGAEYKGRRTGRLGHIACFSFYPGKNLGAFGEGGAVVTGNPDIDRTVRSLRNWGADKLYHHVRKGFNYRLDALQAAVLRVKLKHLDAWNDARRANAERYRALLAGTNIAAPVEMPWARHVYNVFAVRTPDRAAASAALERAGAGFGVHYPLPLHRQPAWLDLGYPEGAFPVAEQAAREALSLPVFPGLSEQQIDTVAAALRNT